MSSQLLCSVIEVLLLQGRIEGTLIDLHVERPKLGTGGGLRPVLCSVALLCLPHNAGCSVLRTNMLMFPHLHMLPQVLFLLFLSVAPAASFTIADHSAFPKT